jgi:hypothetical protein
MGGVLIAGSDHGIFDRGMILRQRALDIKNSDLEKYGAWKISYFVVYT